MDKVELETKVNAVLNSEFEIPMDTLVRESDIKENLELDSLDAVDLLVILEEELNVEVDPEKFMECKKLGDIYDVIYKLTQEVN